MTSAVGGALHLSKRWLAGTSTGSADTTATTTFDIEYLHMDRSIAVPNGTLIYSLGVKTQDAFSCKILLALENSSTSFTFVQNLSASTLAGSWTDVVLPWPYLVPASGTYRLGFYASSVVGTEYFQGGAINRSYKIGSGDPGLTTVTGFTAAGDGTMNLRYTTAI